PRRRHYEPPANVVGLHEVFCQDAPALAALPARRAPPSRARVLSALRRLHLDERPGPQLLADLIAGDLSLADLLHGGPAFEVICELSRKLAPDASFLDFFWNF